MPGVGRQAGIERDPRRIAEQNGKTCIRHPPGQATHALAGEGQVGLVLGLQLADFGGTEHVVRRVHTRVQAVLGDTAVPGFGDHRFRDQAAVAEMTVDEGRQFRGRVMSGHGRSTVIVIRGEDNPS